MSDLVVWIRLLFSDCLARSPFGVGWELDRAEPPLIASVMPADMPAGHVRLDRDDIGARIDFASRLQALLDVVLERPAPWCPAHRVGLTPTRVGDDMIWSCHEGDFQCELGQYELAAFWPPTENDRWAAPLLSRRFAQCGVRGLARFSVQDDGGRLIANVAVRPETDEQAVRDAAAPLPVDITHVPAISTVREWRPATEREPTHEVLTVKGVMHRLALLQGSLRRARPEDDCDFLIGDTHVRLIPDHQIGPPNGPVVLDGNGIPFGYEGDEVKCGGGFGPPEPVRGGTPVFNAGVLAIFGGRGRQSVQDDSAGSLQNEELPI
jgi:hypothetical protein